MEDKLFLGVKIPYYKNILNYFILGVCIFLFLLLFLKKWYYLIYIIILVVLYIYLYINQCKYCKKFFAGEIHNRTYLRTIISPYSYSVETRYCFSNGSYKNSKYSDEIIRDERIEINKDLIKCKHCNSFISENEYSVNLDIDTRPDTKIDIITDLKAPRRCVTCNNILGRGRIKYCSECRPTYSKTINN